MFSSNFILHIYPYLNYAVVVWRNTYPSNLNKLCTLQNKCIHCMFFADSRESSQVFYKLLDILKFDNIVRLSICVQHIRYLTSLTIFLHCFMIPSEQSLACTSITPDTPPRVIFIDQK